MLTKFITTVDLELRAIGFDMVILTNASPEHAGMLAILTALVFWYGPGARRAASAAASPTAGE
ncbi:hypothetical protein ACIREO_24745 [Streptomyces sp. NPDC102441]|uniref:hypothetical protein n=1 Tax=Streptomyces sp. NPDC102441 TaxID=3366176 RepID=UPI00382C9ED9